MTTVDEDLELDNSRLAQRGWNVIVWDDPVNLMNYVVYVFKRLFGFTTEEATRKMLEVHVEGRSVVATRPREQAELLAHRLHHYGLWSTIESS